MWHPLVRFGRGTSNDEIVLQRRNSVQLVAFYARHLIPCVGISFFIHIVVLSLLCSAYASTQDRFICGLTTSFAGISLLAHTKLLHRGR